MKLLLFSSLKNYQAIANKFQNLEKLFQNILSQDIIPDATFNSTNIRSY